MTGGFQMITTSIALLLFAFGIMLGKDLMLIVVLGIYFTGTEFTQWVYNSSKNTIRKVKE